MSRLREKGLGAGRSAGTKNGTGPICRDQPLAGARPEGASHKLDLAPFSPPCPPEPVKPEPLLSLLDEAMGPARVPSDSGEAGGTGASHLDDAWASDGTWRGMGRRSRREIVRIPLHAAIAIFAIGALVFCLLIIAAVPKSAAVIGWIVFWTAGVGLIFLGLGWEALIAMRQREGPGIFVLIPPLDLYYFINQWDKTRKALLTVLAGVAVCGGSFGTIRLAEYLAGRPGERFASPQQPKAAITESAGQETGGGWREARDRGFRVQGSRFMVQSRVSHP